MFDLFWILSKLWFLQIYFKNYKIFTAHLDVGLYDSIFSIWNKQFSTFSKVQEFFNWRETFSRN